VLAVGHQPYAWRSKPEKEQGIEIILGSHEREPGLLKAFGLFGMRLCQVVLYVLVEQVGITLRDPASSQPWLGQDLADEGSGGPPGGLIEVLNRNLA